MAHLSDLKLKYRLLIQGYPFRRVDWRPGTRLTKPLKEARIALVTQRGSTCRTKLPSTNPSGMTIAHFAKFPGVRP